MLFFIAFLIVMSIIFGELINERWVDYFFILNGFRSDLGFYGF